MYSTLIVPEVVIAIASLLFFTTIGLPLGPVAIVITHAVFNTSVVTLICRARLAGMDRTLEEASADLGADRWATFRGVTLPQLAPAILAGGLLAFTFSFDDFIVAFFAFAIFSSLLSILLLFRLYGFHPRIFLYQSSVFRNIPHEDIRDLVGVNEPPVLTLKEKCRERRMRIKDDPVDIVLRKNLLPTLLEPHDLKIFLHSRNAVHIRPSVEEDLVIRPDSVDDIVSEFIVVEHVSDDALLLQKLHRSHGLDFSIEGEGDPS